VGPRRSVNSF